MGFPTAHAPRRLAAFLLLCVFALALLLTSAALPVRAEEEAKEQVSSNFFIHMVRSVGPVFGPLLLIMSIAMVFLIVLLAMDLRMAVAIPPGFVEDFTGTVNQRKFKEAYDLARQDTSFLARVLTTGMGRLQYGIDDAREAAFNMVETIKSSKEQLINYLAVIGTLGPLFGLVGTVVGMILAFQELSASGGMSGDGFLRLAKAISHALVVTLLGIGISIPAIFAHTFFRNRLTGLTMDTANIGDDLLTQMYHNSRKPGAGPVVPGAAPASAPQA